MKWEFEPTAISRQHIPRLWPDDGRSVLAAGCWLKAPGMMFYKLSGSGNDFVFIDGRRSGPSEWPAERIREVCARRSGVGADGLVILEPGGAAAPDGTRRVRFHYFNADGNRSDMCGNAALCSARLAAMLDLADPSGMILETDIGVVPARCIEGPGERAEVILPDVEKPEIPNISRINGESWMTLVQAGVPHLVVRVEDVDAATANPNERGRYLRHHDELGPAGANVNFIDSREDGSWRYRTFERGVEGETLACGTGAIAVAAAIGRGATSRDHVVTETVILRTRSGCILEVRGDSQPDGSLRNPMLRGEGRLVFIGNLRSEK